MYTLRSYYTYIIYFYTLDNSKFLINPRIFRRPLCTKKDTPNSIFTKSRQVKALQLKYNTALVPISGFYFIYCDPHLGILLLSSSGVY